MEIFSVVELWLPQSTSSLLLTVFMMILLKKKWEARATSRFLFQILVEQDTTSITLLRSKVSYLTFSSDLVKNNWDNFKSGHTWRTPQENGGRRKPGGAEHHSEKADCSPGVRRVRKWHRHPLPCSGEYPGFALISSLLLHYCALICGNLQSDKIFSWWCYASTLMP